MTSDQPNTAKVPPLPIPSRPTVAVIGGGPAGLMAAEVMAAAGARVTVYERMPSLGRKFLLAGRGGLNLTHSEELAPFLGRYGAATAAISPAVEQCTPTAVREWAQGLGQETFVGTSGRVFPVAMKASPLLRAWLRRLDAMGVTFSLRHRWTGWTEAGALLFEAPVPALPVTADIVVLALGGASWPKLGADGSWIEALQAAGVVVTPLAPANCGFLVPWSEHLRTRFAGAPLKRIGLAIGDAHVRGEAIITADGIEGGTVYALSREIREMIDREGEAHLHIDLRIDISAAALAERMARPRSKQSLATFLRKQAQLSPVAIAMLHEAAVAAGTPLASFTPEALAALIKAVPIRAIAPAAIERAISTAGGVAWDAMDAAFMLKARPGVFVAGEMIDWEAPTGGYLLQGCFATGQAAARGALAWWASEKSPETGDRRPAGLP